MTRYSVGDFAYTSLPHSIYFINAQSYGHLAPELHCRSGGGSQDSLNAKETKAAHADATRKHLAPRVTPNVFRGGMDSIDKVTRMGARLHMPRSHSDT